MGVRLIMIVLWLLWMMIFVRVYMRFLRHVLNRIFDEYLIAHYVKYGEEFTV
nr:MAG TPA_asm: hypothetical protein [Bacteriophage sp.]